MCSPEGPFRLRQPASTVLISRRLARPLCLRRSGQTGHPTCDAIVIGHTIGFDLAVLERECERIGQRFEVAAALDVRLLSQLCEPNLAGYELENLAAWLNV